MELFGYEKGEERKFYSFIVYTKYTGLVTYFFNIPKMKSSKRKHKSGQTEFGVSIRGQQPSYKRAVSNH